MSNCGIVEADYYSVGDREIVYTTTVEEAIQQWEEEFEDENHDLPTCVEVNAFSREVLDLNSKLPQWWLEHIIENLDENYGCEETWGDYEISEEARVHWDKFVECVCNEYPVTQLYNVGVFEVDPKDYLHD